MTSENTEQTSRGVELMRKGAARIAETEFGMQHVERAMAFGVQQFTVRLRANILLAATKTESPLELAFMAWWEAFELAGGESWNTLLQFDVEVDGQVYRPDITVFPPTRLLIEAQKANLPGTHIAIELDGHEFHERTKEQVEWRNRRDRALAGAGWLVLHYSGSEFNRDPEACVASARSQVRGHFEALERRVLEARMANTHALQLVESTRPQADETQPKAEN